MGRFALRRRVSSSSAHASKILLACALLELTLLLILALTVPFLEVALILAILSIQVIVGALDPLLDGRWGFFAFKAGFLCIRSAATRGGRVGHCRAQAAWNEVEARHQYQNNDQQGQEDKR